MEFFSIFLCIRITGTISKPSVFLVSVFSKNMLEYDEIDGYNVYNWGKQGTNSGVSPYSLLYIAKGVIMCVLFKSLFEKDRTITNLAWDH